MYKCAIKPLLIFFTLFFFNTVHSQIITTIAGTGVGGYSGDGGPATAAQLRWPHGLTVDNAGNIYIGDHDNHRIRKVSPGGIITTYAGTGVMGNSGDGGPATAAKVYQPSFLTVDNNGNLYFIDPNAISIRKINSAGVINTIAGGLPMGDAGDGGPLAQAQFMNIAGLAFDAAGNFYISDFGCGKIRKVDAITGIISTVAGTGVNGYSGDGGPATSAKLDRPYEVSFDNAGNMYIPDAGNNRIRRVDAVTGSITTYAGTGGTGYSGDGGPATSATLWFPWHSAMDNAGNLYVSDGLNLVVRKITPAGIISTYAGTGTHGYSGDGGPAVTAQMSVPAGITVDAGGNVYVVQRDHFDAVRKITACLTGIVTQQPSDVSICNIGNASFSITGSGFSSLRWEVNTGSGWSTLSDNAVYSGTNTTMLSVAGIDPTMNNYRFRCAVTNACAVIYSMPATLRVAQLATPAVSITSSRSTVCAGTTVVFNATVANGGAVPSFQWRKNGQPVGSNSAVYSENNLNNGDVITCMLTSSSNCVTTNSATSNPITMLVTAPATPGITISPSANNICSGVPVIFSSTITYAGSTPLFQWRKNGVPAGTNSPVYTDAGLKNGDIIQCMLTSSETCVTVSTAASNAVQMNVNALLTPAIIISASKPAICPGEIVTFNSTVQNGGTAPVYKWQKNGLTLSTTADTYTDANLQQGDVIKCTVISSETCVTNTEGTSNSVVITVFASPAATLDQTPSLCAGSARILDPGKFKSYLWNDGSTSATLSVTNTGTYFVTVTDNNSCTTTVSTKITTLLPRPSAFLPANDSVCSYGTLTLRALSSYKSYVWNDLSTLPTLTISKPGVYWLEVTDNNQCKGKDTIVVSPKQCLEGFFVPTAFTPNNDRKNDTFKPLLFGNVQAYKFSVFNRWGQLVFSTSDVSKGWDGSFRSAMQTTNVFVWVCSFQFVGKPMRVEKGNVVLIR